MKTTLCIAALGLLIAGNVHAQKSPAAFTFNGKLSGKPMDSVFVDYANADGKYTHAAEAIKNGTFSISGNINHPTSARLLFKTSGEVIPRTALEARTRQFYIEPGTISLTGDATDLRTLKITGSKTELEYQELQAKVLPIRDEMKPVLDEYYAEKDHEKQAAIRDKFEPYQNRIKKATYAFFIAHPTSYITADQIKFYVSSMRLDSIKRVYDGFNTALKESDNGKELAKEIKDIESGSPGVLAAVFSKNDIDGKPLSLADFKGKYVMLDFWASWCVPCRAGNPHMIALYNKYKGKGLEIIGISDDDTKPELWKAAVAKDGVGIWKHVLRGLNMQLAMKRLPNPNDINSLYGIHTIPTKILIDPQGKIVGRFGDSIGGTDEDMDKMLASVFK
ncbi:AhpC/TSA family protein [Mucilaginibacter mali]|uniref:AhpC/TSA family protein n=1 Tax=Mucilaginibacter mali TaxID=2740462 RepID=A0A7D4PUP6_9SPHI|nr:TlpA disulfide reductase family protein [Mucilaginibacter mali]QKJ30908.1 AhpC/TSA family protein [Mucilaginibacter mali]